jgi:hypothetical protein
VDVLSAYIAGFGAALDASAALESLAEDSPCHRTTDRHQRHRRAYGATGRTPVLIRADGYVALSSDAGDLSAVPNYLAAIGGAVAADLANRSARLGGIGSSP